MHNNPKCVAMFQSNFSQDVKIGSDFSRFQNSFDVVLGFTSYPPTGYSHSWRHVSRSPLRPVFWRTWHVFLEQASSPPGIQGSNRKMLELLSDYEPNPRSIPANIAVLWVMNRAKTVDVVKCVLQVSVEERKGGKSKAGQAVWPRAWDRGFFSMPKLLRSWRIACVCQMHQRLSNVVKMRPQPRHGVTQGQMPPFILIWKAEACPHLCSVPCWAWRCCWVKDCHRVVSTVGCHTACVSGPIWSLVWHHDFYKNQTPQIPPMKSIWLCSRAERKSCSQPLLQLRDIWWESVFA